jgi:hypothetical protein
MQTAVRYICFNRFENKNCGRAMPCGKRDKGSRSIQKRQYTCSIFEMQTAVRYICFNRFENKNRGRAMP